MITIQQANNGCILTFEDQEENATSVYVYDQDNLTGLQEMIYDVLEIIAPTESRYSRQRITVNIVHGDKYECKDKNCEICKV